MLTPLKSVPLNLVVESLSWHKIKKFNKNDTKDINTLNTLKEVAKNTCIEINKEWILRSRPNEVWNDVEVFIKNSFSTLNLTADTPKTKSWKKKSTWYPDLEFIDKDWRYNYVECKTYNIENIDTTQRSFYLSPSDDFKITKEAVHYVISIEIYVDKGVWNKNLYKSKWWKILSIDNLDVDVKYEFNSDNKRLYSEELILSEWKI
jgi:hypothetical protein